ncbi:helix-turn-helix domain-containing protein [Legionella cardiaca]|uniref:AraC family transcriptional regulator n=1 Tax=Legionella cardiaca TaxID=1071983 RepID=A0ABY8AMU6_9GAMM|nr:AraC family transcriptional regulator [Legionella cardiaca]WED41970.1 AraC family transcriptional regulator [Legionella cardiaca]
MDKQHQDLHPLLYPYIKSIEIAHQNSTLPYHVYPSLFPTIGFQINGELALLEDDQSKRLKISGITGLITRPRTFQIISPSTKTILVKFYPWGVPRIFKEAANTITNQSIGLDDLVNAQKIINLEERIQINSCSSSALLALIQEFFLDLYISNDNAIDHSRIMKIALDIAQNPNGTVAELGMKYGFSQRNLERQFLMTIGLSPKKYMLTARFQQTLKMLLGGASWSSIANNFNFHDQAHFIKEFKAFSGMTPYNLIKGI